MIRAWRDSGLVKSTSDSGRYGVRRWRPSRRRPDLARAFHGSRESGTGGLEEAAARQLKRCPELSVDMRQMAKTAAWRVSSCKPGNGVVCLSDDSLDTYWQSDGKQTHFEKIQFHKKVQPQLQLSARKSPGFPLLPFNLARKGARFSFLLNLLRGGSLRDYSSLVGSMEQQDMKKPQLRNQCS